MAMAQIIASPVSCNKHASKLIVKHASIKGRASLELVNPLGPISIPLGALTREGAAREPARALSRGPRLQEHEVHVLLLVHLQRGMLVRHPLCNNLRSISDQLPVASANAHERTRPQPLLGFLFILYSAILAMEDFRSQGCLC